MTAAIASLRQQPLFDEIRRIAPMAALFAVIGAELAVLALWLPDTLEVWFDPETHGYGDFPVFYRNAETFSLNALYSPGLTVLMHPLTYFGQRTAFTIYFGVNVAALASVGWLAQRGVASLPAKAAVMLGVFALPQTHWALRVGHFTEILALSSLAGLLLCDRRPVTGGLCLAALALKPQYLPVPVLYLLWTRNWRALGTMTAMFAVLGVAGVAASALRDPAGAGMFGYAGSYYLDRIPEAWTILTVDQRDGLYPQGWQYSWYGWLLSAGLQPNPLLAADLMAVSLGAMLLAWWKCTPSVAKVAAALGMLLLTPHTSFYNWSMLAVAAALLLRSDLRPRALVPAIIGVMAMAAAATQKATPFPLPYDAYRPAATLGLYWVQPAALLAIAVLAVAGRRAAVSTIAEDGRWTMEDGTSRGLVESADNNQGRGGQRPYRIGAVGLVSLIATLGGAMAAAFITGSGPFASDPYFGRAQVLRALPDDFPAPAGAELAAAGAGSRYPYRVEWESPLRTSEVAGLMRQQLDDGSWRVVDASAEGDGLRLRSARDDAAAGPVVADVEITPDGDGSRVRVEFTPLPASSVPGYDEWLISTGIVVHNIEPGSPAASVTPAR